MSTTCRCGPAGCGPECRLLTTVGITAAAGLPAARRDRRNLTTGRLILDGPPLPQTPLTNEDLTAAARHISQHRLWPGYTRGDQQRYVADIAATLRDQRERRLRHSGHLVASILRERRAGRGLPPHPTSSRAEGPAGPSRRPRGSAPAWETGTESPAAAPARVQHPEPRPPTPPADAHRTRPGGPWVAFGPGIRAGRARTRQLVELLAGQRRVESLTVRTASAGELPDTAAGECRVDTQGTRCWAEILLRPHLEWTRELVAVDHEAAHLGHLINDLTAAGDDWPEAWRRYVDPSSEPYQERIATAVEQAGDELARRGYRDLVAAAIRQETRARRRQNPR